jgi:hypothetical protein
MTTGGGPARTESEIATNKNMPGIARRGVARRPYIASRRLISAASMTEKDVNHRGLQVRLWQRRLPSPIATELTQSSDLSRQGMMTTTVGIQIYSTRLQFLITQEI